VSIETGTYSPDRKTPTVAEAVDHWLDVKRGQIRRRTLLGYLVAVKHIKGPLLSGTSRQRAEHTLTGMKPEGAKLISLIGEVRLSEFTTADIRAWHITLQSEVSLYAANRAKMCLAAALALAEEDLYVASGIPVWTMENVQSNRFIEDGCLYISDEKFEQLKAYAILNGDILISRAGTVGRMAIVRSKYSRSIMHSNLIRLALNRSVLIPEYFVVLMTWFGSQVARLKTGHEDAYTFMNTGTLAELPS
jgi:hypothetical protein